MYYMGRKKTIFDNEKRQNTKVRGVIIFLHNLTLYEKGEEKMNITTAKTEKALFVPYIFFAGKVLIVASLSRTQIAGTYPFGIAYAAVLAEENPFLASIGLILGTAVSIEQLLKYLFASVIYFGMVYVRKFEDRQVKAVALGTAVLAASLAVLFKSGATPSRIFMMLPEAFATGGLYLLFGNIKNKGIGAYCSELLLAGACLGGIYGLRIPYLDVNIAVFASMIIIMSASYLSGIPTAVLTGVVLGFMTFINSPQAAEMSGLFAVSALVGAVLSKTGKTGVSAGFLAGATVCVLSSGSLGELSIADIFAAPIVFLIIPQKTAVKIGSHINEKFNGSGYSTEIAERIKTVARAVEEMGNGVRSLSKKEQDEDVAYEDVAQRVCKDCKNAVNCFEYNRQSTLENVRNLKKVMQKDGFLNLSNAPKEFGKICVRAERFLSEFSHMLELEKQDRVYRGELVCDRELVSKQYEDISNIISNLSSLDTEKKEEAVYEVSVSLCQEAKNGQKVNGDTVLHFQRGNKYFVILCDGMGSGKAAREISGLTARLFSEFLNLGIEKGLAVDMINSALALNADRESFSSADILEIDLCTAKTEFLKVGSAQSFIKTNGDIEEVSSSALPVGILESIEVKAQSYELSAGDEVLMVTDGIGEAGRGVLKNDWIKKLFLSAKGTDSERVKLFVEGAKARALFSDDMTGVIIKIKNKK